MLGILITAGGGKTGDFIQTASRTDVANTVILHEPLPIIVPRPVLAEEIGRASFSDFFVRLSPPVVAVVILRRSFRSTCGICTYARVCVYVRTRAYVYTYVTAKEKESSRTVFRILPMRGDRYFTRHAAVDVCLRRVPRILLSDSRSCPNYATVIERFRAHFFSFLCSRGRRAKPPVFQLSRERSHSRALTVEQRDRGCPIDSSSSHRARNAFGLANTLNELGVIDSGYIFRGRKL